jgi:hypothetical protein
MHQLQIADSRIDYGLDYRGIPERLCKPRRAAQKLTFSDPEKIRELARRGAKRDSLFGNQQKRNSGRADRVSARAFSLEPV